MNRTGHFRFPLFKQLAVRVKGAPSWNFLPNHFRWKCWCRSPFIIRWQKKRFQMLLRIKNLKMCSILMKFGLFYRLFCGRSLTNSWFNIRHKKNWRWVTVALCCSADGSKKLKSFLIGKSRNPNWFRNFSVGFYILWLWTQ